MGNFTVTGELGAGKTVLSVAHVRDEFLLQGKKLASNVDLYLEHLMPAWSKATYTRVTDYPQLNELMSLGKGSDSKKESTFGAMLFDELSMWLNSHNWNQSGRDEFIVFQRHLRKRRWHTIFIAQDIESIDKQARNSLVERVVKAGRTDRLKIPFLGTILRLFGFSGNLPQWHIGEVKYGKDPRARVQARWKYSGQSLYDGYDTEQEFHPPEVVTDKQTKETIVTPATIQKEWAPYGEYRRLYIKKFKKAPESLLVEVEGMYTYLSAWHIVGRYQTAIEARAPEINRLIFITIICSFFFFIPQLYKSAPKQLTCKDPDSYMTDGLTATIVKNGLTFEAIVKDNKAIAAHGCYTLRT